MKTIATSFIILVFILTCCKTKEIYSPTYFKGSNTSKDLVSELASHFNKSQELKIKVDGGGSEKAITDFLNGDLLALNSSRKLTQEELSKVEQKHGKEVKEVIIALDAVAIIVNPKLGVHDLTLQQISDILSGKIKNWKELNGPNKDIFIYGRDSLSGTHHFIKDKFIENRFAENFIVQPHARAIVQSIKNDIAGIGYVDLSSITDKNHFPKKGIWAINIIAEGQTAISPFERMKILDGTYPLTRPLYQYLVGVDNQVVNDFIAFELSDNGQLIVEKDGFFPIQAIHKQMNADNGFELK